MPVEKQSGVGFLTPGLYLVFKTMNCSLWTCSKSLIPYSIQFIKFLLWPLPRLAFLLFFLSPSCKSIHVTANSIDSFFLMDEQYCIVFTRYHSCCMHTPDDGHFIASIFLLLYTVRVYLLKIHLNICSWWQKCLFSIFHILTICQAI